MIKADTVLYVASLNGETFEFKSRSEMMSFIRKFHSDGYAINTLSLCKMKLFNINPPKFS